MKARWKIIGTLTTNAPLHIGSGDAITFDHPHLKDNDGNRNEIQAVVRDFEGKPCLPGTAIKGVLRSWAERMLLPVDGQGRVLASHAKYIKPLDRIFGLRAIDADAAEAGRAEFVTARVIAPEQSKLNELAQYVPYWNEAALTGILSHVCIDRELGTAADGKLFYQEFVPEGIAFQVEIDAARLDADDIALLLEILEQGSGHATHPYRFGANGADGWGCMTWERASVTKCSSPPSTQGDGQVGFGYCTESASLTEAAIEPVAPACISASFVLACTGPFLVNDASRVRHEGMSEEEKGNHKNFTPLRRANGSIWMPASSLRGTLRQRCEFLLRSLDPDATGDPNHPAGSGPIERIFGFAGNAARLSIQEPRQLMPCTLRVQDFVAIDRFTGGAADGAKFDATYAERPQFHATLTLDLAGLQPQDVVILGKTLQQLFQSRLPIGWGKAKSYGEVQGKLMRFSVTGVESAWEVPSSLLAGELQEDGIDWLNLYLESLFKPTVLEDNVSESPKNLSTSIQSGMLWVTQTRRGWDYKLVFAKRGGQGEIKVKEEHVSTDLRNKPQTGTRVDFEMEGANRVRIRPEGEQWHDAATPAANRAGGFAHPYYFVRMEDRSDASKFSGELGCTSPAGHRRYKPNRYSGQIRVKLTVKTPLLICDNEGRELSDDENDHWIYPVLRDAMGKPSLASSSVRGMLRSSYEVITNSRFGVFPGKDADEETIAEKHGRRLGFRLPTDPRASRVPSRVISDPNSPTGLAIELLPGTATISASGTPQPSDPQFAAWFRQYDESPRNPSKMKIGHRTEVWAFLTPWRYFRKNKNGSPTEFNFWNVEEIQPAANGGAKPTHTPRGTCCISRNATSAGWDSPGWFRGFICITLNNMSRKHDERFFFCSRGLVSVPLSVNDLHQWRQLIEDYHDQHERDIQQGRTVPTALQSPRVYSRHISVSPRTLNLAERELCEGDLVYADVAKQGSGWEIKSLYPVMISRKLYQKSPLECLPDKLRPAVALEQLSPADRVFGWVNQDKSKSQGDAKSAYRSHVRISNVSCETEAGKAIDTFDRPKTLTILAQPKPQQGRFYLGDQQGRIQPSDRLKEQAGYSGNNRIRGPKVYPHHKLAERYESHAQWEQDNPNAFSDEQCSQNRSIRGWVMPGTVFEFDLNVENLTAFELGALLWLLSLPEQHYLRLGLGKPLGFGSVRVEIDEGATLLAKGDQWIESLKQWEGSPPGHCDCASLMESFKKTMQAANAGLLSAFEKAAAGFGELPIHYPRIAGQVEPNEHFHWFVENEKQQNHQSLPDLSQADVSLR